MLELVIEFADEQVAVARSLYARHLLPAMQALQQRVTELRHAAHQWLWPTPAPPAEPPAPAPTIEDHFAHAAEIVTAAIASLERIELWQSAAADHVDAAEYAFQRMLGELATAMSLPVDGAPLPAIPAEAAEPSRPAKKALAA